MEGTVKFFNEAKGFGFVIDDSDGTEYFTHISGLAAGVELKEGDKVEFTIEEGRKGLNATNVTVV
jgi:CspA family cold shock protein